jgi:hypothetical protein
METGRSPAPSPRRAVAAHHCDRLQAAREAGKRYGEDQANVVAKDFGPNQKRACESRIIERIGPAARI